MFGSIGKLLRRVGRDIRARRNIESYVVSIIAVIVAVVGLIDDAVPDSVQTSVILAALGLLVFSLTRPEERKTTIEDYLHNRAELGSFAERVSGARKLWIYAPSATNILDGNNLDVIRQQILNDARGEVRVLIQNPDKPEAVALLVQQLDKSVRFQHQHLPDEIAKTLGKFQRIRGWDTPGTFGCGTLDYSPGFSIVIVDPHRASGTAIIELYGWRLQSTGDRMSIEIKPEASPRWFAYWVEQYEYMWTDATRADGG